jgi:hypothetical protein
MKQENNSGKKGSNGTNTNNKGESQHSKQRHAQTVSTKSAGKHTKDESHGADENTTKKQSNSI